MAHLHLGPGVLRQANGPSAPGAWCIKASERLFACPQATGCPQATPRAWGVWGIVVEGKRTACSLAPKRPDAPKRPQGLGGCGALWCRASERPVRCCPSGYIPPADAPTAAAAPPLPCFALQFGQLAQHSASLHHWHYTVHHLHSTSL